MLLSPANIKRTNPNGGFDSVGALGGMCELLWRSQFDRHGTADESVPLTVSQAECETALHLGGSSVRRGEDQPHAQRDRREGEGRALP